MVFSYNNEALSCSKYVLNFWKFKALCSLWFFLITIKPCHVLSMFLTFGNLKRYVLIWFFLITIKPCHVLSMFLTFGHLKPYILIWFFLITIKPCHILSMFLTYYTVTVFTNLLHFESEGREKKIQLYHYEENELFSSMLN